MTDNSMPRDNIDWDHHFPCSCRVKLIPELHSSIYGYCDWHWRMAMSVDFENW